MIISNNNSGLCNRIKCWASSVRIDADCFVDWPQYTNVRYKNISTQVLPLYLKTKI